MTPVSVDESRRGTLLAARPSPPIGLLMPEAVVDLPDPMSPPTAPAGNADELLSQLAGEQIDRMLSEADDASSTPSASPAIADEPIAVPIIPAARAVTEPTPVEATGKAAVAEPLLPHGTDAIESAEPSPLIRVLEMINAPLAASPAWVRDLLGAVAILTLVNAVGAIVFLMFFKHR